ncbi:TylF/MycF/NovP-related O-methyltransferase [Achromobacter aloeverae]|uniref:Methyltransferase n=1 Tax=Achromobacter aloeverae TaxID=1750518 RepID=A0A4Q1HNW7_9BURK|nr:TylF/MycF/NovP-related O-methyltransferase [Achromobacter aloeverae]RXN92589.1 hypothetical protein C7R54_02195 [Achromobacter aloeverae]
MVTSNSNVPDFLDVLRSERRDLLARLRATRFPVVKPGYSQAQVVPHATYAPWLDDAPFMKVYEVISANTLVDIYRCYELTTLARQVASLPGDLVEVGVWRGGTAALLAHAVPEKNIALFDTFSGVAKADAAYDTLYKGGEHADTDRDIVTRLFDELGLRCAIHAGMFPDDTLDGLPGRISLAHIDVDTYLSAKESFDVIWPRVVQGGMVVFDDYGFWGCEGVTQFVNEDCSGLADGVLIHNLNGHAVAIKTSKAN